jgi:hypothetical protein
MRVNRHREKTTKTNLPRASLADKKQKLLRNGDQCKSLSGKVYGPKMGLHKQPFPY